MAEGMLYKKIECLRRRVLFAVAEKLRHGSSVAFRFQDLSR
jgi:hypothetical protein